MNHALLNGFIESRNGFAEDLFSGLFVILGEGFSQVTQGRTQTGSISAIALGTSFGLAGALERRKMVCHYWWIPFLLGSQRTFRWVSNKPFYWSITLKTVARKTLGMDYRFRKELVKQLGVKRFPALTLLPMDASATTFDAESFDCIYSRAVFEHLSDPRGVLREIRRILKPGGAVVIFFHLYTSDTGCHDTRIFAGRREHIPYWSHLRPEHRHLIHENTYLNRLRISEWRTVFSEELPGSVVRPHNDADQPTQNALRALRAKDELSAFTDEELLSVTVEVSWAKPLN